jgi:hypothetical protein
VKSGPGPATPAGGGRSRSLVGRGTPDFVRPQRRTRSPTVVRNDLPRSTRAALTDALLRVHELDQEAARGLKVGQGRRFSHAVQRSVPTLKSIAALAGVSYVTVSRVVNGSEPVAPATAARVTAIVNELGYRPNGNAVTLHK